MKTATVTEFRSKMKEHLQEIENDQDILILSGPKKKDFVVLTLEQYNAMEETAHLLSTQANTIRLMESIAQDKAGDVQIKFRLPEEKTHKKRMITPTRLKKKNVAVKKKK